MAADLQIVPDDVPVMGIGYIDPYGQRYIRLSHLDAWLEDFEATVAASTADERIRDGALGVLQIERSMLREVGRG